jgi:hypothetical protein
MVTDEGDVFDVLIPEFVLSMPRVLHWFLPCHKKIKIPWPR